MASGVLRGEELFQSTLPMRGATMVVGTKTKYVKGFQSTLPMRGAT